ncbi:MAG: protein translocase subunit SecDF [Gilvibacter sp.]
MQNKGLITVFAILFGLVSLYQLSYTFISAKVEDDAKVYSQTMVGEDQPEERALVEKGYIDSLATTPVMLGIDYKTAKEKELKRGLDLQGGINVILQISVKDILSGLANKSQDPVFLKALNDADELQKDSQDTYLESFYEAFEAIPGDNRLASPDIFANKTLSEEINFDMTNDQVKPIIAQKIDESITSAFEVLRKRIDKFGVTQPNIQRLGNSARILVELPGAKNIERATTLLQSTAQLEFWDLYKFEEVFSYLNDANSVLADLQVDETPEAEVATDSTDAISDLLGGEDAEGDTETASSASPLFDAFETLGGTGSATLAVAKLADTAKINAMLRTNEVVARKPQDIRYAQLVWGKPYFDDNGQELTQLYALKGNREDTAPLGGGVIVDAAQGYDNRNRVAVDMQMNGTGAKVWEEMTGNAYTNQSQIAVVLDDIVYSAPGVSTGAIAGGRTQITGDFTVLEGQDLANVLRAGKLPASADIIQGEVVGPTLGKEAISSGMMSFGIALLLVLIWMVFYYGRAGIYADIALLVNILFIFGCLAGLPGAVLTLPGIAGIVLTIGISVDANVLIFERIREELAKGKVQKLAIKDGFNNALSSILDANITTGLTGIILLIFGTGPIKGFATTLLIGILTSLFTAIFITRLFIDKYTRNGKPLNFSTPMTKNLFANVNIDFLKKRKIAYIISGILIAVSLTSLFTNSLNMGVDFVGGRTYTVRYDKDVNAPDVTEDLIAVFGSAEAKTYGGDNQLKITTKYKVDETGTEIDKEIERMLYDAVKKNLPAGMTFEDFTSEDDNRQYGRMESYKVSPTIADDIKQASVLAVLGSLLVVFLYILLRFRRWQFSLGAVAAVFHDVLIVLGIFSLTYKIMPFNMEIDQSFIAAILTVIGYSLNDTVVVFDRIREYFNEHSSWKMNRIINSALNSTLSRTLNTSLTTLIVLLCIFTFGAESIRGLIFALMVGVVVGTYSSMFIATPVMYDTVKKRGIDLSDKKDEEEPTA